MAIQIVVPTLGEAISEATLVHWSKNEGDPVRRGDEIAELETDKASFPLECPANGILLSIAAHPGDVVKPGQVLALVGRPGDTAPPFETEASATAASFPAGEQPEKLSPPSVSVQADEAGEAAAERGERISPAARRLARQKGIDLSKVTPSRPGARITSEDVERAVSDLWPSPKVAALDRQDDGISDGQPALPFHIVELSRIQKAVAARMVESASQIPQFSVSMDADVSRLLEVKHELTSKGVQASLTALLVLLTARALRGHPLLNARFDHHAVLVYETVNMAVAVSTEAGLVAPVLHGVEKLSLPEIIRRLGELVPAARENRLSLEQVSGATFTLSNLGMRHGHTLGVRQFVPLVNPPQSAILGVGAAHQAVSFAGSEARAAMALDRRTSPTQDQGIDVRWMMTLTVSADHRVLDGEAAARFLGSLCEEIEKSKFEE